MVLQEAFLSLVWFGLIATLVRTRSYVIFADFKTIGISFESSNSFLSRDNVKFYKSLFEFRLTILYTHIFG